jgi:hypothetical protein
LIIEATASDAAKCPQLSMKSLFLFLICLLKCVNLGEQRTISPRRLFESIERDPGSVEKQRLRSQSHRLRSVPQGPSVTMRLRVANVIVIIISTT